MSWIELTFWLSANLIFYTYIGYPLLLLILAILTPKSRKKDENYLPTVSMVISAYNEEASIAEKIENCLQLSYPKDKLEIIIGSDASNDQTDAIIRQYACKNIRLISFSERRGKASVLNDIIQHAKGEIVVFSDANTMYKQDAIYRLVIHFSDAKVGGVCGRLILIGKNGQADIEGEKFYWDFENYLKYLEGKVKTVFGATGAVYAIRKEHFERLPGHKAVMDDFLIPLKIVMKGFDVVYEKDAIVWENTAPNLRAEFTRKARIGAANFNGIREILPLLNPQKGFIAFGLWSHKIIRWLVPFLLIMLLASNIFLLGTYMYNIFFGIQLIFYGLSVVAWKAENLRKRLSFLVYPYYFVIVNGALLAGFFRFLKKSQQPAWTRVER
jgi:cellulose synthase/poly-beta-1,6-N-acetylglucosamine synthase-like glycosyltransferase